MQKLTTYFTDFLQNIALTNKQREALQDAHKNLRTWLVADPQIAPLIESSFLQGSYRRATITKPDADKKPDVDIIVVTNLDKEQYLPSQAMDLFKPFLEKYYSGKWRFQGRSIGIELDAVDLDLVITALPDEATREALKSTFLSEGFDIINSERTLLEGLRWGDYLWIPDRDAQQWLRTHPLAQIRATIEKNQVSEGHYLGVVKATKWWRKLHISSANKLKSYPLEHIIWANCPDKFSCIPEGIYETMAAIRINYTMERAGGTVPFLSDHGIPEHNVLKRLSFSDFATFYDTINSNVELVRSALHNGSAMDACRIWKDLLGAEFPSPPKSTSGGGNSSEGGFSPRTQKSRVSGGRFAL